MIELEPDDVFHRNIKCCKTEDNIATDLIIAVMTVCATLGSPINLLDIFDYYMEEKGYESFELSYVPNSTRSQGIKNKAFYNCLSVSFYYKDINSIESRIVAKVFPNGSIQFPGCKTMDAVHKVPEILYNFISSIAKECKEKNPNREIIKNIETFKLRDVRIVMINSNFTFEKGIKQDNLKTIINNFKFEGTEKQDHKWRIASFQPEKYSGINARYMTKRCREQTTSLFLEGTKIPLKLDGQVSVFIFRSGKGTITGAKNTKDLLETYQAITELVRKNKDSVFAFMNKNK